VDGVIGVRHPPALPYSPRLSQRRERGRGSLLFVLYPLSNIVIPLPLRRRLFFSKNCVGLCSVIPMRCVTTCPPPFFCFYNLSFPSPRLSIHSLLPIRRPPPARARSPVSISYRIVLYYNTYPLLRLTDRLTNVLFVTSMVGTV